MALSNEEIRLEAYRLVASTAAMTDTDARIAEAKKIEAYVRNEKINESDEQKT